MVTVKVPATSANMGSGFDSVGVALQLYNVISAEEIDSGLKIEVKDESVKYIPLNERNLVYRAMMSTFDRIGYKPEGLHIVQTNNVPVTRGMGSSSACIVGGIMAANEIGKGNMTKQDIVNLASYLEGHPDNVTPAVTGGMAVAVKNKGIKYLNFPVNNEKLSFAVYIPNFSLRTKVARAALPELLSYRDASYNIGRAALLTSAMLTENYDLLATALQDRMHQYYRKRLIGGSAKIFYEAEKRGAIVTYISGSGSALVSIVKKENEEQFYLQMNNYITNNFRNWQFKFIPVDNAGATVCKGEI
ncbi:MAG: homoserine kinase [Oscillospiraceae bacterium]|nr:homoserine kinase [Oscillospiraceae bacterium]